MPSKRPPAKAKKSARRTGARNGRPKLSKKRSDRRPIGDGFFRTVIENSSDVIGIVESDGTLSFLSPSVKRVLGVEPEDVIGQKIGKFLHPDDAKRMAELFSKAFRTPGAVKLGDFRTQMRDGTYRHLEGVGKAVFDGTGKSYLIANAHDITDRKLAEEALRESEERYRVLAEMAHDMIFIVDREGKIEYVNKFAAEQYHSNPEDLIGKPRETLFPGYIAKRQWSSLAKVFQSGEPLYLAVDTQFPTGRKLLDTWLVPIKDKSGSVRAVFGTSRDVTAYRTSAEELERRTKEAEIAKIRAQTYFDFLAHDIANLVSPILTYSETIRGIADAPRDIRGYTDKIYEQAEQMASFILNLRMLAEAEKVVADQADRIDLREVFSDLQRILRTSHPGKLKLSFDLPVNGSIDVLGGLHIRNALLQGFDYCTKLVDGRNVPVDIKVRSLKSRDRYYWQIRIEIHGKSHDGDLMATVTTPFDPSKRFRRKSAGSLSFAVSIIEHFGGRMSIQLLDDRDPSKGNAMIIELPKSSSWSRSQGT